MEDMHLFYLQIIGKMILKEEILHLTLFILSQNGKIFDPQSGVNDLKNKKIKFIGNPDERIKEDYLRILRFIRFSIEYSNFDFEKETLRAIQKNLSGITKLSKERIYSELKRFKIKKFP